MVAYREPHVVAERSFAKDSVAVRPPAVAREGAVGVAAAASNGQSIPFGNHLVRDRDDGGVGRPIEHLHRAVVEPRAAVGAHAEKVEARLRHGGRCEIAAPLPLAARAVGQIGVVPGAEELELPRAGDHQVRVWRDRHRHDVRAGGVVPERRGALAGEEEHVARVGARGQIVTVGGQRHRARAPLDRRGPEWRVISGTEEGYPVTARHQIVPRTVERHAHHSRDIAPHLRLRVRAEQQLPRTIRRRQALPLRRHRGHRAPGGVAPEQGACG